MRTNKLVLTMSIVLVFIAGLLVACCAQVPQSPGGQEQPTAKPQEPTAEVSPIEMPTEPAGPTQESPLPESPVEMPVSVDGEALLQDRCARCHGLERTVGASKTREEWATTVDRMIDKGVALSAEERDILISYLAETYGE